jgi:phosphatidylglycerophosphatase C
MGIEDHSESPGSSPIVAFDFDGTVTIRDSFNAFLAWRVPPGRLAAGLARLIPGLLRYAGDRDRQRLKVAAVKAFLAGLTPDALTLEAEAFAEAAFARLIRPDARACWEDWGRRGALRVIVTASPELIVGPFARRLGAERLIGTRLAVDSEGRLTGALDGPNCRAAEKVVRLRAAFGPDVRLAAAYGDSSGDVEMLEIAEVKGMKVFHAKP